MLSKTWGLGLASALAMINLLMVIGVVSPSFWLAWIGIAMTLVVPGYALSTALLPDRRGAERLLLIIGSSLVLDVVGGLVLNATPWGLQPRFWALWLGGITIPGCLIAWFRHRSVSADLRPNRVRLNPGLAVGIGLSLIFVFAAVILAQLAAKQRDLPFTQLWALPSRDAEGCVLQVGINNQENQSMRYDLYVESNGNYVQDWQPIELGSTQQWTNQLSFAECPTKNILVSLYRLDQPNDVYRMAQIVPTSFAASTSSSARDLVR